MKKIFILLVILSTIFFTGCSMIDSTEELTHPPRLEGDKENIKLALKEYLPQNTRPIIPPSEDKGSAIKLVDLDGDGIEEAVIFYSIELEENPIRILVLKKEGERWINKAEIKVMGQDLDKALFKDLNGDGGHEIIIGSKVKYLSEKNVNIYSMNEDELEIIFKSEYDDILIEDLNNDTLTEILLLSTNKETGESYGELYKYIDYRMNKIDKVFFNERAIINYVKYDYIYNNKKGIIISTTGQEDYINIYMLKVQDGKLVNLLKEGLIQTKKQSNARLLTPKDIDSDGVIEFALSNDIQEGSKEGLINWVTKWYSFDGIDGVKLKKLNYYDEKLNFTFELPLKWNDKLTITNLTRNENTIREEEYVKVEYKKDENTDTIELFTVYIYNKDKLKRLDDNKRTEGATKVLEDRENIYYLKKNNEINSDKFKSIYVKVKDIEKSFKFLSN